MARYGLDDRASISPSGRIFSHHRIQADSVAHDAPSPIQWVSGTLTRRYSGRALLSAIHPDIRVNHCPYGHSVATLLKPRGVTTVSHKYSLTVARHTAVVVAVPSNVHYPANYVIKM
jgi:hypothetical protein